jgi:hypothetical protein
MRRAEHTKVLARRVPSWLNVALVSRWSVADFLSHPLGMLIPVGHSLGGSPVAGRRPPVL